MTVKKGDFIRLDFTGKLEDGTLFDTTVAQVAKDSKVFDERITYKPVLLVVGRQQAIKGLDEAVIGMSSGDEKDVNLPPEKAFGQKNPDLITVVPTSYFNKEKVNPVPGMIVNMNNQEGMVKSVGAGRVIVDFNHPLAGRDLKYHVKLIEVLETPVQKVKALFDDAGLTGDVAFDKDTVTAAVKADPTENYIFRKQTFLAWMREVPDVKKIKFNEEYELAVGGKPQGHDQDGHDHSSHEHEAPKSAEKTAESKPKVPKPKKQ